MSGVRRLSNPTRTGLLLAALILLGWLISLIGLLSIDLSRLPGLVILAAVVGRTLLQTGLFIVGHDAMHRVLLPERVGWNDRLGALVLALYAALPYGQCRRNHQRHHRFQATARDPDFCSDPGAGALGWYRQFMAGYLTAGQMARLLGSWALLTLVACQISPTGWLNVLLVCTLPLLLSSLQLFVFGTYLPHRVQRAPLLRAKSDSLDLPPWLSLLACFHFGYHREHHDRPALAWFQLPAERRRSLQAQAAGPLAVV